VGIDSAPKLKRAVFLDRDGVVIEAQVRDGKPYPAANAQSMRIPGGTGDVLGRLKDCGYLLIVVTNQPDVARGTQTREAVDEINRHLRAELPLDDVLTCYHDDGDDCECRKPRPGLILRAAQQYGIDLSESYLIGDRWRDIDAGANAGCKTILIERGYAERTSKSAPDARVGSLSEAVDWIMKQPRRMRERYL
jgi:D-glycero-D-manno-heptose 1,7-bisphosphate phosphatase